MCDVKIEYTDKENELTALYLNYKEKNDSKIYTRLYDKIM